MLNNKRINSKKGNVFVFVLISAIFVSLLTIGLSYYFATMKYPKSEEIGTIISLDYQMESAVVMQMQKYKSNNKHEPKSFEKEIMPGVDLSVKCTKLPKDEFVFETTVTGSNIYRKLKIKADKEIPDKLEFLE